MSNLLFQFALFFIAVILSIVLSIFAIIRMIKCKDKNIFLWIAIFILIPCIGPLLCLSYINNRSRRSRYDK